MPMNTAHPLLSENSVVLRRRQKLIFNHRLIDADTTVRADDAEFTFHSVQIGLASTPFVKR
jgi:hypothetical protein